VTAGSGRCGAVYVELAERPEDDRVVVCVRPGCVEHPVQLAWIKQDSGRSAAYAGVVGRLRADQVAQQNVSAVVQDVLL
jgi:hypothetical protein